MKSASNWVARVVEDGETVEVVATGMTEHWAKTWLQTNQEDEGAKASGISFHIYQDGWGSREVLSGL
jgi:hypothetical protein